MNKPKMVIFDYGQTLVHEDDFNGIAGNKAMDEARRLKPQIPLTGNDDLPIAHEFEFEILLLGAG